MKYIIAQIIGAIAAIFGLQGGIRLLSNNEDAGLLAGLPGDVSLQIGLYVAITVLGGMLVSWAYKKSRASK